MTIAEYKERLEQEKKIAEKTLNKYLTNLRCLEMELQVKYSGIKFPELLEHEEEIHKNIVESSFKDKQQRYHSLKSYIIHMNLPYTFTIKKLSEGAFVKYESEKKKTQKKFPELKDLIEIYKNTPASLGEDRLYLSLLVNYNILRTDLANVKLKDYNETEPRYVDGCIIYPSLNKVQIYEDIIVKLNQEDIDVIKTLGEAREYLFNIGGDISNRNANYTKFIKRLSTKYFKQPLIQTDFRVIHTNHNFKECGIDEEFIEKYEKISEMCKANAHCFSTALKTYYSNPKTLS